MSRVGGILVAMGLTVAAVSALAQNDGHMMDNGDNDHQGMMGGDNQGMMGDHEGMMGDQQGMMGSQGYMMDDKGGGDQPRHGKMDNGHMSGQDGE
jgi:hypothetical protein